jgi:hypothetical protein
LSKPGNTIHIPIPPEDAIAAFMRVKPTAEMPRPSDQTKPAEKPRIDKGGSARQELGNNKPTRRKVKSRAKSR